MTVIRVREKKRECKVNVQIQDRHETTVRFVRRIRPTMLCKPWRRQSKNRISMRICRRSDVTFKVRQIFLLIFSYRGFLVWRILLRSKVFLKPIQARHDSKKWSVGPTNFAVRVVLFSALSGKNQQNTAFNINAWIMTTVLFFLFVYKVWLMTIQLTSRFCLLVEVLLSKQLTM